MPRQKPPRSYQEPVIPVSRDLPFPLLIRAYRQRLGLTRLQFSRIFSISTASNIALYEKGVRAPHSQIAIELARAFQLTGIERENFLDRAAMACGRLPSDLAEWPGMAVFLQQARRAKAAEDKSR